MINLIFCINPGKYLLLHLKLQSSLEKDLSPETQTWTVVGADVPAEWNRHLNNPIIFPANSLLRQDDGSRRRISPLPIVKQQTLSAPEVRPAGMRGTPRQEVKADPPIKPLSLSALHLSTLSWGPLSLRSRPSPRRLAGGPSALKVIKIIKKPVRGFYKCIYTRVWIQCLLGDYGQ